MFYDIGEPTNITYERDPVVHARRKERLTPGFRTQALRDQEHVIHENVDLLLDQLIVWSKEPGEGIDVTKALEWLMFDIIGAYKQHEVRKIETLEDAILTKSFRCSGLWGIFRRRQGGPVSLLGLNLAQLFVQLKPVFAAQTHTVDHVTACNHSHLLQEGP